jgi:tetratricopeptide (TPR) repeat protein
VRSAVLGGVAMLAAILGAAGGPAEAARAAEPYVPDAVFNDCGAAGDPQARVAACNRVLAVQGKWTLYYGWAFGQRASAYYQLGDWDHAALDAKTAIDFAPSRPWGYVVRGALALRTRQFDKAVADLGQAIRVDKTNAQAFQLRGQAYEGLGDAARAIADYEQALKLRGR